MTTPDVMFVANLYMTTDSYLTETKTSLWLGCNVWMESDPAASANWRLCRTPAGLALRAGLSDGSDEKISHYLNGVCCDDALIARWREEHASLSNDPMARISVTGRDSGSGRKDDSGKPDLSLIPRIALIRMAEAFDVGNKKYGRYNFCGGLAASRVMAALLRHATAWFEGEETDPTDGQHHLGSVMACAAMILRLQELERLDDDRYGRTANAPDRDGITVEVTS